MRIYTRTGDDGSTGLFGGARVSKADPRVAAYGEIDELNAVLGWVCAGDPAADLGAVLEAAQPVCFRIGAFLAAAPGSNPGIAALVDADVEVLEAAIDKLEADLAPLKTFVLPGGVEAAARLHVARTVCRRAERSVVALSAAAAVDPLFIRWLNRLSDLLFVMARWANANAGTPDVPWTPRKEGDA